MRHPEDEQMLRYADGELPAREVGEVRSHLEACWQCRAQFEELQNMVGQCVAYRKNVLQRHLPAPPVPWTDIYVRFSEIDASFDRPSLLDRAAAVLQWPMNNVRKWVPVAVAAMIVWGVFFRFRLMPSVQAAELLRKAVIAADAHPGKMRRMEIRTRQHRLTRFTGSDQKLVSSADAAELSSLQTMFRAANYDWDDPLSARSYQSWRNQLSAKTEQVIQEKDAYSIQTDAAAGELREATLKLRTQDLQPVEGRFDFRNGEWVEIAEIADGSLPAGAIATLETHHDLPASAVPNAVPPAAAASAPAATAGDELHVWAALHQVGADLGDPIEVSRAGAEVLVTGVSIAPDRQREIRDAIGSQPNVAVRFSESGPAAVRPEKPTTTGNPSGAEIRPLQARVAEQIGGRANFEELATQVLDLSEPMMSRVYALRRLAERFPIEAESQLSAADHQVLRQLKHEHTAALRKQTADLNRLLEPALGSVSAPSAEFSSNAWQPATEELFQSARRVEKLLAVIFGAAPGESADEQLPSQLLASLAQLRAKVEVYDRLSSNTGR